MHSPQNPHFLLLQRPLLPQQLHRKSLLFSRKSLNPPPQKIRPLPSEHQFRRPSLRMQFTALQRTSRWQSEISSDESDGESAVSFQGSVGLASQGAVSQGELVDV